MFPMEHGPPSEGSFPQAEGREPLKKEMLLELREGSGLPENNSTRPLSNAQTMFLLGTKVGVPAANNVQGAVMCPTGIFFVIPLTLRICQEGAL